jgi:hypothetical protein
MTIVKYIISTGVCTSGELIRLARENKSDYESLIKMAREQMTAEGVEIEETVKQ